MNDKSKVFKRQKNLLEQYLADPKSAWITDVATVESTDFESPFHTSVSINDELKIPFPVGVHRALGGYHDIPNPGDILCAALASCFESSMRMIADRLGILLESTKVKVEGNVDVRGTLMVDRSVFAGFQQFQLTAEIRVKNYNKQLVKTLIKATEYCCVTYQTIKQGTPIHVNVKVLNEEEEIEKAV